jgi:hypothetical protein
VEEETLHMLLAVVLSLGVGGGGYRIITGRRNHKVITCPMEGKRVGDKLEGILDELKGVNKNLTHLSTALLKHDAHADEVGRTAVREIVGEIRRELNGFKEGG